MKGLEKLVNVVAQIAPGTFHPGDEIGLTVLLTSNGELSGDFFNQAYSNGVRYIVYSPEFQPTSSNASITLERNPNQDHRFSLKAGNFDVAVIRVIAEYGPYSVTNPLFRKDIAIERNSDGSYSVLSTPVDQLKGQKWDAYLRPDKAILAD